MPRRLALAGLALSCLLGLVFAQPAQAHKVNVFAYAEGGKVYAQGYFNDGKPAMESTVEVYDAAGKLLVSGKTNDAGEFSFPLPAERSDLKIVLVASMGHKNEYLLRSSEIPREEAKAAPAPRAKAEPAAQAKAASPAPKAEVRQAAAQAAPAAAGTIDEARLRAIVDQSLDARLLPLTRMVARLGEDHVRFTDVVGGIGYIFGLAGLAAFFASRKRRG